MIYNLCDNSFNVYFLNVMFFFKILFIKSYYAPVSQANCTQKIFCNITVVLVVV